MTDRKPNILFLIADDHRAGVFGGAGNHPVETPVLDRLAAEGTAYSNCYHMGSDCPAVCAPARAALHTGNHPRNALIPGSGSGIAPGQTLLGETFRAAGYETFAVGKWHNDAEALNRSFSGGKALFFGGMDEHYQTPVQDYEPGGNYGRHRHYCENRHSSDLFAGTAVEFIERRKPDAAPFFLYVAFTAPHDPRTPPPEFGRDRYLPKARPPENFLPEHPHRIGDDRIRDELLAPHPRTEEDIRRHWADYYGMIAHMDLCIGRMLRALGEAGEMENTIVVYTSDHGLGLGSHGLLGKQNVYEHSIKVPLILCGPGIPQDGHRQQKVHTPDLYPTLCELAGVPVPESVADARSLVRTLRDDRAEGRDQIHSFYKDYSRTIIDGEWKLSRLRDEAGETRWQLFHLSEDPGERTNRIEEEGLAPVRERLKKSLETEENRWMT